MIKKLQRMFGRSDLHMVEVLLSAKVALVWRVLGAGLSFLFSVALSRLLGAEGAGVYFMALSVMMLSGFVGRLGLDKSLLKFVARGASGNDWLSVHGVFRMATRWAFFATAALAVFWALSAQWCGTMMFREPAVVGPLRIMGVGIISLSMTILLSNALLGVKQVAAATIIASVLIPAIGLLVIWPFTHFFGPEGAALSYLTGTVVASLIGYMIWRRAMRQKPYNGAWFDTKELWESSRPLWMAIVVTKGFMPWGPLFFLSAFASATDVGVFGAALRVSLLLSFALTSVNTVMAPKFAELHQNGDIVRIASIARQSTVLLLLVSIPVFLVIALFGDFVMGIFGEDFRNGGQVLAVLAFGQLFSTISGSILILLSMTGNEKDVRTTTMVAATVTLLGSLVLIPPFGILGAAWTVSLSVIVSNLVGTYQVWRRLGIIIMPIPGNTKKFW